MEKPWYSFLYIKSPITKIVWGIASILVAIVAVLAVGIMEDSRMEAQTGNWEGRSIEKGAEIYLNNCYTCHGPEGKGGTGPALNSRYFFEHRVAEIEFAGTLEDYVKLTIAAGRPNLKHGQFTVVMPNWSVDFGGPLRNDQVEHVTNYVMNWESTALLQTPEEDPFIPFAGVPRINEDGTIEPVAVADTGAERTPLQIFGTGPQEAGLTCYTCHDLNAMETADSRGALGPNLGNLAETAGSRVPGEDAATYVRNSIVNPTAHTVEGYITGLMPSGLDARMTPEELDALVAWLIDPERVTQ